MVRFFNTLTRRKEAFAPRESGVARMYTCGPTVYRFAHIGNMRTYLMADAVRRLLQARGLRVEHVKNITDVGHMRQDMVERGEDKMIAAALKEGKTLDEIAAYYTGAFRADEAKLNILPASVFPKATDHIPQMIDVTNRLLDRGHAYVVEGNVYFDVASYERYGQLSGNQLDNLLRGVRVEVDPLKRNQTDFALWKAAEPGRMVKWDSPWGEGFPGWHIECSAMSTAYLGQHLDIHTGGVDNIFPHHEDELAQSEGAFGGPFVGTWMHGQHLLADGLKMAKSTGNSYTLAELEAQGFEPLAYRYLCLTTHYRSRLNFTFQGLRAAQRGLARLRTHIRGWALEPASGPPAAPVETAEWSARFWGHVEDDLGLPEALAELWKLTETALPGPVKLELVRDFDRVLGLDLATATARAAVPGEVRVLLDRRVAPRAQQRYAEADALRTEVRDAGYEVRDTRAATLVLPRDPGFRPDRLSGSISSPADVPSLLDTPDRCLFSMNILAHNYRGDVQRCVDSALASAGQHDVEVVIVDNFSGDGLGEWAQALAAADPRVRVIRTDHRIGEGAGRNIGLKQSRGRYIMLLDTSVEFAGDAFTPLAAALAEEHVGAAGAWGVHSHDLRHFDETPHGHEVDAVEAYCLCFRRALLQQTGLLDEKYRFYRNLDLDFSVGLRALGLRNVMLEGLPLIKHEHRGWNSVDPDERDRLSRRNFNRFLEKWGARTDLLAHTRHAGDPEDGDHHHHHEDHL